ncbi:MAG: RNA-binding transcriptional accessory protein [Planctomycetes bacterium]|nr:RNA-binding transcriptional accessory protein [Planctomycetota bacterium]
MTSLLTLSTDLHELSTRLKLRAHHVEAVVAMLDDGNTVPFITRYRKDQTGGLDEEQIRAIQEELRRVRQLAERKQTILRSIEAQGKLTPDLAARIKSAPTIKRLEDLYLPYRPQKQTLATTARSRGLGPLADEVLSGTIADTALETRAADFVNPDKQLASVADVLLGVGHILAEQFSERVELRSALRGIFRQSGQLICSRIETEEKKEKEPEAAPAEPNTEAMPAAIPVEGAEAAPAAPAVAVPPPRRAKKKKKPKDDGRQYRDYFEFRQSVDAVPPHRVLAINRGERAKVLRVRIEADLAAIERKADELLVPAEHPQAEFLRGCGRDALARLVVPSLERELRREMTERAEAHAVRVFARNLRSLLLTPPVRDRRTLAVDPGIKSGCKLTALDPFGKMLGHAVVLLVGGAERRAEARAKLLEMIKEHEIQVIAIGNGTGCREAEEFVCELLANELKEESESGRLAYVIVNEAGASVYSTSQLGREEFPDYDATLRGAISIGRRLQDPLSELVKIDPASIGVGLYQHDVKANHLRSSLDEVVESCVNYVGVDVNTASTALLRYVSGLNQLTARRLFEYRHEHGPFRSRAQLRDVPGFGEATFVQAAGFLKITGGDNPLDSTWIHPESYPVAEQVLAKLGANGSAPLSDAPSPGVERGVGVPGASLGPAGVGEVPPQSSFDFVSDAQPNESTAPDSSSSLPKSCGVVPGTPDLAARVAGLDVTSLAGELGVGTLLLSDILAQLSRPPRDPREALPPPIFKRGVMKLEDLSDGMELSGTVLNVVDFGAFVDIGLHDSGLVHVSRLANRYVKDPNEVISIGDIVRVWVTGIDKSRRRVSLTMIPPGTQREGAPRRGRPQRRDAATESGAPAPAGTPTVPSQGRRPRRGRGGPPQGAPAAAPATPSQSRPPQRSGPPRKPDRPKPLVPITKKMLQGKEPMRTFGDLLQFVQKTPEDEIAAENEKKKRDEAKKKSDGPTN